MSDEKLEAIMEEVCDLCHWPFVEDQEDQEALDARCEKCPVVRMVVEAEKCLA